jgi:hypothetical protein
MLLLQKTDTILTVHLQKHTNVASAADLLQDNLTLSDINGAYTA